MILTICTYVLKKGKKKMLFQQGHVQDVHSVRNNSYNTQSKQQLNRNSAEEAARVLHSTGASRATSVTQLPPSQVPLSSSKSQESLSSLPARSQLQHPGVFWHCVYRKCGRFRKDPEQIKSSYQGSAQDCTNRRGPGALGWLNSWNVRSESQNYRAQTILSREGPTRMAESSSWPAQTPQ